MLSQLLISTKNWRAQFNIIYHPFIPINALRQVLKKLFFNLFLSAITDNKTQVFCPDSITQT
ncbi:MAG: hypothetical protein OQL19_04200, partial [Gammaproteobacteria bacterium]|nr:hypothetical protein [Gammaproteobacteria bacterium]